MLRVYLAFNIQLIVVILFIIKVYDLFTTAIMMPKQNLFTDRIIGKICLINGVFPIVILLCNTVSLLQDFIVLLVQKNNRIQLLGITHQHQIPAANDWDQRNCQITLTGFIHNHHIKISFRTADFIRGNTGRCHNRKDMKETLYILRSAQIGMKRLHLFLLFFHLQNFP